MGLGKTLQIIAFLSGLFLCKIISRALIVCPLSLIEHWVKEINRWHTFINFMRFTSLLGIPRFLYGYSMVPQNLHVSMLLNVLQVKGVCA